jgi:hypothetical protein
LWSRTIPDGLAAHHAIVHRSINGVLATFMPLAYQTIRACVAVSITASCLPARRHVQDSGSMARADLLVCDFSRCAEKRTQKVSLYRRRETPTA